MAIKGVIFDNQKPTAKQFGHLFRSVFGDGKVYGMAVSSSGSEIVVPKGVCIVCGRVIEFTETMRFAVTGTGFARVVVTIDTSKASTTSSFEQVSIDLEEAATQNDFAELQTTNINNSTGKYQWVVCIYSTSNGAVVKRIQSLTTIEVPSTAMGIFGSTYYGDALPSSGKEGQIFFLKSQDDEDAVSTTSEV